MKVLKRILGLKWHRNEDGAAFYQDKDGGDWYEQRNALLHDKPIIVVESDSRLVRMFWIGEPSYVGLLNMELDVYQLDDCPIKSYDEFMEKSYKFIDEKFEAQPENKEVRKQEDILADLDRLRAELTAQNNA